MLDQGGSPRGDADPSPADRGPLADRGVPVDRGAPADRGVVQDRGRVDPPRDAAPRPDMAPTRDRGLPDMAVDVDVDGSVGPDAHLQLPDQGVCEPLQCMTALGELATSPCSAEPVAACGPPGHELCECGMRDRGFFFDPTLGLGRPPNAVTYVYQPAPGDGRHARLFIPPDTCIEPMATCAAFGACAGHQVLTWLVPRGVQLPVVLTVMDHPQCQDNILAQITIN